ncbi:hypothetical protein V499_08150 [Pseudogymnoascus sp. VKM F-103]|nr:hypothetical protein V499_08150 [Pseudogymnoascus sp. VKM F-103]
MAPKKGSGGSYGGGSSGGDEDYDYGTGTGSGSGDTDYDYSTGSGSGSGSGSGDNDYDYGTGTGSGSGSGYGDYDYGTGSGSGGSDDYNYDYGSGGPKNSNYNTVGLATSSRWKDATVNALFAMNIIALLVLVLCMILTRRFKWIREKGTDKLRNSGYLFAAFCMFLHLLIVAIRTAMVESGYHTDKNFVIAFIFERLFSLIGDIMIVAIIARTILEDMSHGSGKLAFFSNVLIGLLWVLALVAFSFYAALYGQFIAGNASQITNDGSKYTAVFFSAYIFGISMYLAILSCVAVFKRPSKGTFLMIFIVIPALFLRFLFALVNQSIINFQSRSMTATATAAVGHADSYMYTLTTISIFLVVALIGGLRQRHSEGGMSQEQKIGLQGHHYVPLGPYGQPPAPYGAPAPVGHYLQPVQPAVPEQYAASGQPAPQPLQVPASCPAQGQYVVPDQPSSTGQYAPPGQYAAPVQPVSYAPPGQYAASGQYVHQGMTTPSTIARSVSPMHDPVAVSAAFAYNGAPSTVSPPPPHDLYQMHMPPHH